MSGSELFKLDVKAPELVEVLHESFSDTINKELALQLVSEIGVDLNLAANELLGSGQNQSGRINKN